MVLIPEEPQHLCFSLPLLEYQRVDSGIVARAVPKRPCEDSIIWFTFTVNRRRWTVWLSPYETLKKSLGDPDVRGLCLWERAQILIDASMSLRLIRETAIHEIAHACHGYSKDLAYFEAHEKSVLKIEKKLFSVLTQSCGLRFPPLPHAWRSLQRRLAKYASQVES